MRAATAIALCVALAACGVGEERVTGTVVAVDGDLTTVVSFDVQTARGVMRFVPGPGLTRFSDEEDDDGAYLTHLRDHLRDGNPVVVTFRVEDGVNVAVRVADAP